MKHIKNVDIHKMNKTQIDKLIEKYVSAGWTLDDSWNFSIHQWLTFVWDGDGEPPKV